MGGGVFLKKIEMTDPGKRLFNIYLIGTLTLGGSYNIDIPVDFKGTLQQFLFCVKLTNIAMLKINFREDKLFLYLVVMFTHALALK